MIMHSHSYLYEYKLKVKHNHFVTTTVTYMYSSYELQIKFILYRGGGLRTTENYSNSLRVSGLM